MFEISRSSTRSKLRMSLEVAERRSGLIQSAGATIGGVAGVTQLAECLLPKQDVVGSNPITRSPSQRNCVSPTRNRRSPALAFLPPFRRAAVGSNRHGRQSRPYRSHRGSLHVQGVDHSLSPWSGCWACPNRGRVCFFDVAAKRLRCRELLHDLLLLAVFSARQPLDPTRDHASSESDLLAGEVWDGLSSGAQARYGAGPPYSASHLRTVRRGSSSRPAISTAAPGCWPQM